MPDINGIPYVESTDLVSAYPAASQALAQEISDQLASKIDYALPVNAQTGTAYTFVAADAEKLTTASNGSAVTLTIPPQSSVTWSDNTVLRVVNYGAGAVTIDGGSGVTVTNTSSTIAQYGAAVAIRTGSDAWTVVPFGGGDIPAATVSSPAATGQYTDTGITYDYYTFTASGTLTVDTAGFADILLVGGGGSGGAEANGSAGGGGAGGYIDQQNVYLETGTLTVTVGAGAAGVSALNRGNIGNKSQLGSFLLAPGGGGGGARATGVNDGLTGGSGAGATINAANSANGSGGVAIGPTGNNGGNGLINNERGGGGGGASAAGGNVTSGVSGNGGAGLSSSITGSSVGRAGGGGGAGSTGGGTASDGGSAGVSSGSSSNGTANTGGGSGGGKSGSGNGGSGVVIVRVKV